MIDEQQPDKRTPQRARTRGKSATGAQKGQARKRRSTSQRRRGQHMGAAKVKKAKETFLAFFRTEANVTLACEAAGIGRSTVYEWKEKDVAFEVQWHQAELAAQDVIRHELVNRAIRGWLEPVINGNGVVYETEPDLDQQTGEQKRDSKGRLLWKRGSPVYVLKKSDSLLQAAAKAWLPEFKDKLQLTGADGGPIKTEQVMPDSVRLAETLNILAQYGILDAPVEQENKPDE